MNSLVQLKSPAGVHPSVAELAGVKPQLFPPASGLCKRAFFSSSNQSSHFLDVCNVVMILNSYKVYFESISSNTPVVSSLGYAFVCIQVIFTATLVFEIGSLWSIR